MPKYGTIGQIGVWGCKPPPPFPVSLGLIKQSTIFLFCNGQFVKGLKLVLITFRKKHKTSNAHLIVTKMKYKVCSFMKYPRIKQLMIFQFTLVRDEDPLAWATITWVSGFQYYKWKIGLTFGQQIYFVKLKLYLQWIKYIFIISQSGYLFHIQLVVSWPVSYIFINIPQSNSSLVFQLNKLNFCVRKFKTN